MCKINKDDTSLWSSHITWFHWELGKHPDSLHISVRVSRIKHYRMYGGNLWELHGWQPRLFLFTTSTSPCAVTTAFHSSWRSSAHKQLRSFLAEDSCQDFHMSSASGEHHAVFFFPSQIISSASSRSRKAAVAVGGVFFTISDSQTRFKTTVEVFVWPNWSWTRTGPLIWYSTPVCKWNSTSAGLNISSFTFPSVVWKRARDRERPIRFSNSSGGNGRTGRKGCFLYTRSPLISPHTPSVTQTRTPVNCPEQNVSRLRAVLFPNSLKTCDTEERTWQRCTWYDVRLSLGGIFVFLLLLLKWRTDEQRL